LICGWDLGGAHAKLAVLDDEGRVRRAEQVPCELWRGIGRLDEALAQLLTGVDARAVHAITMTGELTDGFETREQGVRAIADAFVRMVRGGEARFFTGSGFATAQEAYGQWQHVASANWFAPLRLTAQLLPEALVIDVGSTTTDIGLVAESKVHARGHDDRTRLSFEELVYTGVVRTPLMAIASHVPFDGEWTSVMAEHFATTADLYRITGELDGAYDQAATADGRPRSRLHSMQRLARLIGCDAAQGPEEAWSRLARWLAGEQRAKLLRACERQLSRGLLSEAAPIVGLGVGRFIAARIAAQLERDYVSFADLAGVAREHARAVDVCGPAFAVARLAFEAHR
jgi:probable H4MPT-linked C1 transfer pathway protein